MFVSFELDEEIYIKQWVEYSILKLQSAMKSSYVAKKFEMLRAGLRKERIFIKKVLVISETSYFLSCAHYSRNEQVMVFRGKKTPRG